MCESSDTMGVLVFISICGCWSGACVLFVRVLTCDAVNVSVCVSVRVCVQVCLHVYLCMCMCIGVDV